MLEKVEVRNPAGALMTLSLEDLDTGLLVQKIEGLDPVKATIVTSDFANVDGLQYQSSRRDGRNILMNIGLEPDYATETVLDLRTRVYEFFMPKSPIALRFYRVDGLIVDIPGRVESCETAMFSQDPAVDISVMCFNPDFIKTGITTISDSTVADEDEFLIDYDGTVDSGFKLTLNVDRDISEFAVYHRTPAGDLRVMEFSSDLLDGDVVVIDTSTGEKGATLTRSTTISSITRAISPQSTWTQLMAGDNYIRVYAEGPGIPFTFEYLTKYGGL